MKTIYIPKGETVHYESLSTDHLIVEGTLEVTYGVVAKQIDGDGVIHAGTVEADIIRIRCIETARTVCRRLIAKVVESSEVFASESAVVSCFCSAAYVETGRLTVTISEIDEVKAKQIINLPTRQRTLWGRCWRPCGVLSGCPCLRILSTPTRWTHRIALIRRIPKMRLP